MKLSDSQLENDALERLGREALNMLLSQRYDELAEKYRYAMAHGRGLAQAIKDDFAACHRGGATVPDVVEVPGPSITAKHFGPNDSNLVGVVECSVTFVNGVEMGLDLIMTSDGADRYIGIEDIWSREWDA